MNQIRTFAADMPLLAEAAPQASSDAVWRKKTAAKLMMPDALAISSGGPGPGIARRC